MPPPAEKRLASRAFRHFARALAFSAQNKPKEARDERDLFETLAKKIPAETPFGTQGADCGADGLDGYADASSDAAGPSDRESDLFHVAIPAHAW